MLVSKNVERTHTPTRKNQMQSFFCDVQTQSHSDTYSTHSKASAHVLRRRAADAADASTAVPSFRAPAAEPRKDRAIPSQKYAWCDVTDFGHDEV